MKNKTIFFIYAHMDDETIFSYGTIKKLSLNNNVIVITLCGNGRKNFNNKRYLAYKQILKNIGIQFISYKNFDLTLSKKNIDSHLNYLFDKYSPNIIFTHSNKDLHFEHKLISEQVLLNCRNIPNSTVKSLYTTVSPTYNWTYGQYGSFQPNTFIDISEYAKEKEEALKLYDMELPKNQLDNRSIDSIMAWNKMHGHTIGVKYAEPYEQVFSIL